jgi:hypothetical protein
VASLCADIPVADGRQPFQYLSDDGQDALWSLRACRPYIDFPLTHTCEPSGGSIFLPILRFPSVPPVNFQNLPPVKKIKYKKILTYILRSIFLEFPIWNFRAEEKRREIRMVKVNVIFNDIRLLIYKTCKEFVTSLYNYFELPLSHF